MKKSGLLSECKVCKFSGFVEACHVVPVNKFELTSSLKDINDLKNLVGLCPNCHWMLDHGKLVLP
jgi:predicted HNH restriction endonuclease